MKVRDVLYGKSRRKFPDRMDGVLAVGIMWGNFIRRDNLWSSMQMKYWPERRVERRWTKCRLIIMHVTEVECTDPHPGLGCQHEKLFISSPTDRER